MPKPELVPDVPHRAPGGGPYIDVPGRLGRLRRWLIRLLPLLLLVLLPLLFARSLFTYVEPGSTGILEVKIGVQRGIQERVYGPGYWFVKPFGFEKMHTLPGTVQVLELTTSDQDYQSLSHAYDRVARIQTSDGFYVDVDVSILYRIADPYKVMTILGPGTRYLDFGIRPKAEPMLKQALGELTTEDFFNSPKRTEKAEATRELLNADLESKGLRVESVLVRYFKYSDEIQKNIEEKKLQDQLVFKNEAEARAATEKAKLARVKQEGEAKVQIALQEGEAYRVQKEAERDLYTRKKKAEGSLLVKSAEAEAMDLKNKAMQDAGADRKVALEVAHVLEGIDTILLPVGGEKGVNLLDLDGLISRLNGTKAPTGAAVAPSGVQP
ncbi:MAG: SPFH domain-containing protein [Candidatus Hydrogenedentes bacterium]|nr:SPFH domain-containing protein [Candidatus Hydrogenedentota bacterium]